MWGVKIVTLKFVAKDAWSNSWQWSCKMIGFIWHRKKGTLGISWTFLMIDRWIMMDHQMIYRWMMIYRWIHHCWRLGQVWLNSWVSRSRSSVLQLAIARRQDVLLDIFLLDGHEQKTFVFVYLPLFLANSRANHDVNLLGGLKFLVEIYDRCIIFSWSVCEAVDVSHVYKRIFFSSYFIIVRIFLGYPSWLFWMSEVLFFRLLQHRCLSLTGPSVMVDLSSMALVMKDVEDIPTLRPSSDLFSFQPGAVPMGPDGTIWVCLKIVYPYTQWSQWLMIIIPTKWL